MTLTRMLKGSNIVVGITGSIAAYKIPFLVRLLVREGAEVRVVMTPSATDFVTPLTLSTLSRHEVLLKPFDRETGAWKSHVELGQWADVMLFAPVTANTLGKMAHGMADNFLVTAYLSAKCPVFIAPAMDLDMYRHPSTQANIEILKARGNIIIEPQTGELASGLSGPGRMEEPENILHLLQDFFLKEKVLHGKKVLVTAGPSQEDIDPVRFLSNRSTGQMGFVIAEEAARLGAQVILVSGPVNLQTSVPGVTRRDVRTAAEMYDVCVEEFRTADITIMAAAVADYTVLRPSAIKLKKTDRSLDLTLVPAKDILMDLGQRKKKHQYLAGFALETDHEAANARKKLETKNLDLVVLNSLKDKGAGFGTTTNKVSLLFRSGRTVKGSLKSKSEIARDILGAIVHDIQP